MAKTTATFASRWFGNVCLLLLIGALLFTWGIAHMSSRVAAGMSRIQGLPKAGVGHRDAL